MQMKHFLAAASGLLFSLSASSAYAIGPAGMAAPVKPRSVEAAFQRPAMTPMAYVKFCINNFADCRNGDGPATIDATPEKLRELRQVNLRVNRSITPQNDAPGEDDWEADVAAGDCEDYVLTKRRRLIELGWSPSALRIGIAYTPKNNGHAVLVVSTTKGDLVLDNRNNAVLNWKDTDLRWVMLQSGDNPLNWKAI